MSLHHLAEVARPDGRGVGVRCAERAHQRHKPLQSCLMACPTAAPASQHKQASQTHIL